MQPPTILVVLQNAYDKGALDGGFNPSTWRVEFESSRTGYRLLEVALDGRHTFRWKIHYTNACPGLGKGAASKLPAQP